MLMLAMIPLTCWLCVLIAMPRKPLPDNEVQELVYSRLLGRHQRLTLLAVSLTGAALLTFILALPSHPTTDPLRRPAVTQVCTDRPTRLPICYTWQPSGGWLVEQWEADGRVIPEGIEPRPPTDEDRSRGANG